MNDQFADRLSGEHLFTRHLGRLLRDAHLRAHGMAHETMPGGRHPRDWGVMAVLEEEGPLSQQRLGEKLGVNRTMMVGVIDGLEGAGLVRRGRNPQDRRSYALELTDAGREALERTSPEIMQTERRFVGALSAAERDRLAELLRALLLGGRSEPLPPVLADRVGYLLAAGYRYSRARLDAALDPLGFDIHGFAVLAALDSLGPCSQQRLSDEVALSGTMIVQLVDGLERDGLVERRRSQSDRRVNALHLTEKGREILAAARAAREQAMDELTRPFRAGEEEELCTLLRELLGVPHPS
jgi:DNA-binding MarR family transcriptional regulator